MDGHRLSLGALGAARLARWCARRGDQPARWGHGAAWAVAAALLLAAPALAQSGPVSRAEARERAALDRALASRPYAAVPRFGPATPAAPQVELAPRANRAFDMPRGQAPSEAPQLSPTLINPGLRGGGVAGAGSADPREHRFLSSPAAGARLTLPMRW